MQGPSVSVVVPSFNQAQFLRETLCCLLGQESEKLEIIVIDGGSSDGSLEIIRSYETRINYWVSEPDRGQSEAINKGFERATGDWISWLNSDDTLLPGALCFLAAEIQRRPGMVWCAGGGWFVDEQGVRIKHYSPPAKCTSPEQLSPWTEKWFAQPGTFIRRDLYERAGGMLRTDLRHAMDLDLWLRMARIAPLEPLDFDMGTYRLHDDSKTIGERGDMEVEVIKVLYEHLGWNSAIERVQGLADNHFELERRHQLLVERLGSLTGLLGLIRKHGVKVITKWLQNIRYN